MIDKLDTLEYWAFVLGTDLLIRNFGDVDNYYMECLKIAKDFMNSEEYKNNNKSGYECLEEYLKNRSV